MYEDRTGNQIQALSLRLSELCVDSEKDLLRTLFDCTGTKTMAESLLTTEERREMYTDILGAEFDLDRAFCSTFVRLTLPPIKVEAPPEHRLWNEFKENIVGEFEKGALPWSGVSHKIDSLVATYPYSISWIRVDSDQFSNAILALVASSTEEKWFGVHAVLFTQATRKTTIFFLYPSHLTALQKALAGHFESMIEIMDQDL